MPSKQYLDTHRQLKVWLTHDELARLKRIAAERNLTLAQVLRSALDLLDRQAT